MDNSMLPLLIPLVLGLVFLAAIGGGASLYFLQRHKSPDPTPMQIRLAQIKKINKDEVEHYNDKNANKALKILKGSDYQNQELGKVLEKYSFIVGLKRTLHQAGIKLPIDRFFILFMAIPVVASLVLTIIMKNPLPLAGLGIPVMAVFAATFLKKARMAKLLLQLPDAMSLITSALRAGHSFQTALTTVVTELPPPVSVEFGNMVNDMHLGMQVKDTLIKFGQNLDSLPDVRMFTTAVLIQREVGGNLAEVLDNLGYTIRERFKIKGQISALTGQSRLTGYVLGCAPAGMLAILTIAGPFFGNYAGPLYTEPLGHVALVIAGIMQVIGFFVMKKIIDIRV